MSERNSALTSKTYLELRDAYENRLKAAVEWTKKGGRVVGTLGSDVPDEIIIAAGMLPLRICSDCKVQPKLAEKYIGKVSNITLSLFDRLIDGTYSSVINHLAISNSNATIASIYTVLREMGKVFPELSIPPMTFIDTVFTKYMLNQERNVELYTKFQKTIEEWSGFYMKESELRKAIEVCNSNRQALRDFDALRQAEESRVTGTEALTVIGASLFMDKTKHTALVKQLTEEAKNWPVIDAPRILVFGSDHENTDLYEILEAAGGQAVFEDQNWGARHYDTDVDLNLPLMKALAGRYMLRMDAANHTYVHERVQIMRDFISKYKIDAVLFYMNENDEAFSWDYPHQKKALDEMGIPSQIYYNQAFPIKNPEGLKEKFTELVTAAKGVK